MKAWTMATISNLTGIHALTASKLAQKAASFKCDIHIRASDKVADAKNTVELLSMGLIYNTDILIRAEGEDSQEAIRELKALIDSQFGEETYD